MARAESVAEDSVMVRESPFSVPPRAKPQVPDQMKSKRPKTSIRDFAAESGVAFPPIS
jgi:hypothetical protein